MFLLLSQVIGGVFLFFALSSNVFAATDVAPHNMTSNTLPTPYVASASSEYDATYKAFNVFDGSATTYWVSTTSLPAQLKLDLGSSGAQTVRSFAIKAGDASHVTQAPKDFTFEGSNDNSTWVTLRTLTGQIGWAAGEVRAFSCVSAASYRYYRLNVSANVAGTVFVRVAELYMYLESTSYTITGDSGGANGEASTNFTVVPVDIFTGTITPNDGGAGGTFSPTSLTWSGSKDAKTFTYTPASLGTKTISVTNDAGLTNPTALTYHSYYSVAPYTILPADLWDNAYSTNNSDYYLSSPFARLVVQTDAIGLKFKVWNNALLAKVAVVVGGTTTVFTPTTVGGEDTFYLGGLAPGEKTVQIIAGFQQIVGGGVRIGTFLKSVEWLGATTAPATTITPQVVNNRITLYGDSTIVGWSTTNPPTDAPGLLIYNHYVNRSVLEECWGSRSLNGDSTGTTVNQSLIDHLTLGNPTHIWLAIGVNDYKDGGHWSASDFGIAYGNLLDRLHSAAPNAVIIAQTPIPYTLESYVNTYGNTRADYANKIATLAGTRSWVTLVDGTTVMASYHENGSHPNTAQSAEYAATMIHYLDLSHDATLSGLTISSGALTPTFASSTTSYTDSVSYNIAGMTFTPTVNQYGATVTVKGIAVTSGSASGTIPLNVGSNTITVATTAQDGITQDTYTITVIRASDTTPPTNIAISSITPDSSTQLTITAQTATDSESGLNSTPYWFQETSGHPGALFSTVWQASTTFINTNLSPNTQYSYEVKAKDANNNESTYSTTLSKYTLSNTPSSPLLSSPTLSSIKVTINQNSNPSNTIYAIYETTTSKYVQADGTLSTTPIWQTYTNWGGVQGIQSINLSHNVQYTFQTKAKNGDNTETTLSPSSSLYTTASTSPSNFTTTNISTNSNTLTVDRFNNDTVGSAGYLFTNTTNSHTSDWIQTNSWQDTNLTPNTNYTYTVRYRNSQSVETTDATLSFHTLAPTPTTLTISSLPLTTTLSTDIFPNSTDNQSGYLFTNTTNSHTSNWIQSNTWQDTNLNCNTTYTYTLKYRNADGTETSPITATKSTTGCATPFTPPTKPDISNTKIIATNSAPITIDNLPATITQLAVSTTQDFKNSSWQDIKDLQTILSKYINTLKLYFKFKTKDGGVSDTIVYTPASGNSSNTASGNTGSSSTAIILNEGDIVKTPTNPDVYIIKYKNNKQYKRLILSPNVFKSYQHLKWTNLKIISQDQLNRYTTSNLVQLSGDNNIYSLTPYGDEGERRIQNTIQLYDQDSVYEINKVDRDSYKLIKLK
jgi:lysophospholipase L1-like esterase